MKLSALSLLLIVCTLASPRAQADHINLRCYFTARVVDYRQVSEQAASRKKQKKGELIEVVLDLDLGKVSLIPDVADVRECPGAINGLEGKSIRVVALSHDPSALRNLKGNTYIFQYHYFEDYGLEGHTLDHGYAIVSAYP